MTDDILALAREQVLERGEALGADQVLEVLRLPDDRLEELLALAHDVRMRWCGPEIEVEGIISLKTGGCPEDCHFCSQSGLFSSPVRSAWLDIPSLVEAAKQTAKTGATEFCIVAAVRGPDERLLAQVSAGIEAIRNEVDIQIACSLGMLTQEQVDQLAAMGVHRYNHNLETARSHFPNVVTTHTWEERWEALRMIGKAGMEVCCGGILGMGETLEQRAEFAAELAEHGVRANVVCPGAKTRLSTGADYEQHIRDLHARGLLDEFTMQASLDPAPTGYVAPLYAYLASDLASSVTGSVFLASGGFVGRFDRPVPAVLGYRDHRDASPWSMAELHAMVTGS